MLRNLMEPSTGAQHEDFCRSRLLSPVGRRWSRVYFLRESECHKMGNQWLVVMSAKGRCQGHNLEAEGHVLSLLAAASTMGWSRQQASPPGVLQSSTELVLSHSAPLGFAGEPGNEPRSGGLVCFVPGRGHIHPSISDIPFQHMYSNTLWTDAQTVTRIRILTWGTSVPLCLRSDSCCCGTVQSAAARPARSSAATCRTQLRQRGRWRPRRLALWEEHGQSSRGWVWQ